jgi:hypothetical protein
MVIVVVGMTTTTIGNYYHYYDCCCCYYYHWYESLFDGEDMDRLMSKPHWDDCADYDSRAFLGVVVVVAFCIFRVTPPVQSHPRHIQQQSQ